MTPPPLALYAHFPWCAKKCPYCDFNSHTTSRPLEQDDYIAALIRDLEHELSLIPTSLPPLGSMFFGGGTPSLFSPESFKGFISGVQNRMACAPDIEITMEANPGTTEHASFSGYRQSGINRLSLGVQSFDNRKLKSLGRIHDADQALEAFHQARSGGFENINIDLMHGLPGQTLEDAISDVETAISLQPEHISLYQLTLEPNTVFFGTHPHFPIRIRSSNSSWRSRKYSPQLAICNTRSPLTREPDRDVDTT